MRRSHTCAALITLAVLLAGCTNLDFYRSRMIADGAPNSPGVFVTWLGTAGVLVSDGRTDILIDPYVSRFGLLKVGLGLPLNPDHALVKQWVARMECHNLRAVVVSHSHFDHALDAPYFARETGSLLMGSESTLNIGRGVGLQETQLKKVQPGQPITIGDFTLHFIESRHGPVLFGGVPYPGTIDHPLVPPKKAWDYKLGSVYAILIEHPSGTLLHHGSAGFLPGMYDGIRADVVMLGITGRGDTETYLTEVPDKVSPRVVIPIHFDDFFSPLNGGLSFLYSAHFAEFCSTTEKHCALYTVKTVPLGKRVRILPLPEERSH